MSTIMAITVGVRDLKQRAPGLVKRASAGERIVITRYGRPLAVLCPVEPAPPGRSRGGPSKAWEKDRSAFESLGPRLVRRYRGKYVAVHGGRVVGADRDADALYERVWKKLGGAVFFIGRVGAEPPIVDMPGMELG
jgi:prevent-host-death family protein